jgi:peptidoglycan glycosyltransferase
MWAPVTGYINPVLGSSTGIEQAMNRELSGTASQFLSHRADHLRTAAARLERPADARPGVQKAAFDALGSYQGAVVALDPKTGRVLAMVTSPSFDTNTLAVHNAGRVRRTTLLAEPTNPLWNRAIGRQPQPARLDVQARRGLRRPGIRPFTPDSTFQNPATHVCRARRRRSTTSTAASAAPATPSPSPPPCA